MIKHILEKYPCDNECMFQTLPSFTTCVYYPPIYNKDGVNTNPDGNITTTQVNCIVCSKKFLLESRFNNIDIEVIE